VPRRDSAAQRVFRLSTDVCRTACPNAGGSYRRTTETGRTLCSLDRRSTQRRTDTAGGTTGGAIAGLPSGLGNPIASHQPFPLVTAEADSAPPSGNGTPPGGTGDGLPPAASLPVHSERRTEPLIEFGHRRLRHIAAPGPSICMSAFISKPPSIIHCISFYESHAECCHDRTNASRSTEHTPSAAPDAAPPSELVSIFFWDH